MKCREQHSQVEFVLPPEGAAVGDRVTAEGFPGEPDEVLNPKKKVQTSHLQTLSNMLSAYVIWPTAWA
jgi:methionyl-tRNA synthetase